MQFLFVELQIFTFCCTVCCQIFTCGVLSMRTLSLTEAAGGEKAAMGAAVHHSLEREDFGRNEYFRSGRRPEERQQTTAGLWHHTEHHHVWIQLDRHLFRSIILLERSSPIHIILWPMLMVNKSSCGQFTRKKNALNRVTLLTRVPFKNVRQNNHKNKIFHLRLSKETPLQIEELPIQYSKWWIIKENLVISFTNLFSWLFPQTSLNQTRLHQFLYMDSCFGSAIFIITSIFWQNRHLCTFEHVTTTKAWSHKASNWFL